MESSLSSKKKAPKLAKIIVVGGSRAGKTSIIRRFTEENLIDFDVTISGKKCIFITNLIGFDFKSKIVKLEDTEIKLQIWDTVGQARFNSIAKNFFKGALGAIFVLDLTNDQSLEITKGWIAQCKMNMSEDTCRILVANKNDLKEERKITDLMLEEIFKQHQIPCIDVSALSGENINELFMTITRDIKRTFFENENVRDMSRTFSLLEPPSNIKGKQSCCG
jgi:small GTP-binding protein